MSTRIIEELATLLGAKVVGKVPDTGGGAFGAARLARCAADLNASAGRHPGAASPEAEAIPALRSQIDHY